MISRMLRGGISSSTDGMRLSNSRLFTDIGLPGGMNGRQAAELTRQQRPDLMVLFTTGCAGNAVVHAGMLDPGNVNRRRAVVMYAGAKSRFEGPF